MRHDARHMHSMNDGEQEAARQHAQDESSFPTSTMQEGGVRLSELVERCGQHIGASRRGKPTTAVSGVRLLRRATLEGDQGAQASFQQCLGEVVSGWLRRHPLWEAAARLDSEETYVTQAFTRFWQATTQRRLEFNTLATALRYLRACLNGALLESLRTLSRPKEVSRLAPGLAGEPHLEDRAASQQVWELLHSILPNAREQRLAYLLYHCGLDPQEIVRVCPQEWSDIQEIYRLRQDIVERLLHHADSILLTQLPGSSWKEGVALEEQSSLGERKNRNAPSS